MRDYLKILDLWIYIEDQAPEPAGVSETKLAAWKAGHDKSALRIASS